MLGNHIRNVIADKLSKVGINTDPYSIELASGFVLASIATAAICYLIFHHLIVRSVKNVMYKVNKPLIDNLS